MAILYENPFAARRYLVVDDFGDMRSMIKGVLRALGATDIEAARDGTEAIDLMQRFAFDVILCDYNLGTGKDGQQVLEEARQRRLIGVSAVFVMVTAENTREMVMGAVEYEPDSYLSKPFSKDLLKTRLEKLLQRKADLAEVNTALEHHQYDQALRLIDARIAAQPKNLAELVKLKADVCLECGKVDAAVEIFEQVLARRDVPWARLGIGKAQFAQGNHAAAAESFRHLVETVPSLTAAHDWLARCQQAMGDTRAAQETLQAAVALSPRAIRRQRALGELALRNGDSASAENAYGAAVKLGRHSVYNHPALHAGLAEAHAAAGKTEAALSVINGISRSFDNSDEANFFAHDCAARVHQQAGDNDAAAACLAAARESFERCGPTADNSMGLSLARTLSQLGEKDAAAELLHTAIRNNHDDEAFVTEATAVFRDAGIDEAPEDTVRRIRQEVVDMNNQGVAMIREANFDEAIALFEKAAEAMPGNRVINLNTARAHVLKMEKQGTDNASIARVRGLIERVQRIDPQAPGLAQVTQRYKRLILK